MADFNLTGNLQRALVLLALLLACVQWTQAATPCPMDWAPDAMQSAHSMDHSDHAQSPCCQADQCSMAGCVGVVYLPDLAVLQLTGAALSPDTRYRFSVLAIASPSLYRPPISG